MSIERKDELIQSLQKELKEAEEKLWWAQDHGTRDELERADSRVFRIEARIRELTTTPYQRRLRELEQVYESAKDDVRWAQDHGSRDELERAYMYESRAIRALDAFKKLDEATYNAEQMSTENCEMLTTDKAKSTKQQERCDNLDAEFNFDDANDVQEKQVVEL